MTKKKNVKNDKVTNKPVSKVAKTTKKKTKTTKNGPLDQKIKQKKEELLSANLEQPIVVERSLCQKVYGWFFPSSCRS